MTAGHFEVHRYRHWTGSLRGSRWSWTAIVWHGIRLISRRTGTMLLLQMSFSFVIGSCALFYVLTLLEAAVDTPEATALYELIRMVLRIDVSGVTQLAELRELLWRSIFVFIIKVQLAWVLVVVLQVGPGIIADDLKNRALPIYFARPVTPLTYLTAKWMVVAGFVGMTVLIPNLLAVVLGTLVTGGLPTFSGTMELIAHLTIAGVGIMLLAGMLILALSSATADLRYAAVGWLAICLLPLAAQSVLDRVLSHAALRGLLGCVSPGRDVMILVEWLFGLRAAWEQTGLPPEALARAFSPAVHPGYPAAVLGTLTVAAAVYAYARVVRFSRAAANT